MVAKTHPLNHMHYASNAHNDANTIWIVMVVLGLAVLSYVAYSIYDASMYDTMRSTTMG